MHTPFTVHRLLLTGALLLGLAGVALATRWLAASAPETIGGPDAKQSNTALAENTAWAPLPILAPLFLHSLLR